MSIGMWQIIQRSARLLLASIWLVSAMGLAQPPDTVTYVLPDHAAEIRYPPDGWTLTYDEPRGFLYLQKGDLNLTFYTPDVLDAYLIGNFADPALLTGLVMAVNEVSALEPAQTRIEGRPAATHTYRNPALNSTGILIAVQFRDGRLGLVDAFTSGDILPHTDEVLAIVATFDVPPVPAPPILAQHAAWQDVIRELEASGFISSGGDLVFVQPSAFTAGTGVRFQGLAQRLRQRDVIVAGTLVYTPSTSPEGEICGLVARYVDEGSYVLAGQAGNGDAVALAFTDGAASHTAAREMRLQLNTPHRFVLLALEERLVLYVDGALIFDDVRITSQAGSYGILLLSNGPARCTVENMWAYLLPAAPVAGVCEITAPGAVNKRAGPGTGFDLVGQLAASTAEQATGQTVGADGLTWWQLADGSWVREDVVRAQGDCRALPQVE